MRGGRALGAALFAATMTSVAAAGDRVQLDPFAQATDGFAGCPVVAPPLMTTEQAGTQAHARAERGTRCALEGKCEPGGAYRRDPEVNAAVRTAIAGERRFADTAIWVTTSRRWVTLQGCVRDTRQRRDLVRFVGARPDVERVFDELQVGTRAPSQRRY